MHRRRLHPGIRLGLVALITASVLPGTLARPVLAATRGACGEIDSLPGPGHYSGGFKGTLVRTFQSILGAEQVLVPVGGTLELDIDEGGKVSGQAASQFAPTEGGGSASASGSLDMLLDGQLPDPVAGADIPGQGRGSIAIRGPLTGQNVAGWEGPVVIHFKDFQRNLCAAVQGSWALDGLGGAESAGRWELRDPQWAAKLTGFDENIESQVRGTVAALVQLPPDQALGLQATLATNEADGLIDAIVAGTAGLPAEGLFALYQKVLTSGAPAAQVRCLTDLVQSAIALKLQEYLAAGASPTYEESARFAYALTVDKLVGAGPNCAAYAAALAGVQQLVGSVLSDAMAVGTDLDRVARLTRVAQLFGFDDLAKQGRDWLQQKGYAL